MILKWHVSLVGLRSVHIALGLLPRFPFRSRVRSFHSGSVEGHSKTWSIWQVDESILGEGFVWKQTSCQKKKGETGVVNEDSDFSMKTKFVLDHLTYLVCCITFSFCL